MTRDEFISNRESDWKRFEELLRTAEQSRVPKMTGADASKFSHLFRAICYDLSLASTNDWGGGISRYLNGLVTRGHNCFYRSRPGSWRSIPRFLLIEFPRLLRANAAYFWVACALFVVPGAIACWLIANDPSLASRVMTGEQLAQFDAMYGAEFDRPPGTDSMMAGFYVRNNVGVAFRCFATGILFGIGTVVFLVFNSIFIGAIAGYVLAQGYSERFFSFVISHGSFELTAIVIAGAGGLILGHALVHPGKLSRREALRERGVVAIKLALGAAAMLCVAAAIEGFWSPSAAPSMLKYIVGTLLWILVIAYLSFAGRSVENA